MTAPPERKRPPTLGQGWTADNLSGSADGHAGESTALPGGGQARGRQFPNHPRTVRLIQLPAGTWHVADTWGVAFAPLRDYSAAVRHAVRHCRAVGAVPDERDPNAPLIARRLHAQIKARETRRRRREGRP